MRIKVKDIAKELGVSPATVSLALNGRQGVKEETREKILAYADELEARRVVRTDKGMVMMLIYVKNGVIMERSLEKKAEEMPTEGPLVREARELACQCGYELVFRIFREGCEALEDLLEECRRKKVKGMYIMAAEMQPGDIYPFLRLGIPVVTGDNLFYEEGIDSYLIDNKEGIRRGVDYLVDKGHSHIVYLAENIDIFNFRERREAFIEEMAKRECGDGTRRIRHLGSSLEEVFASMSRYLDEGLWHTTAFILESSVISLGASKALLQHNFRIPRDISLLGFDALPPVSIPGVNLTLIKGTHTRRHIAGVKHLLQHVEEKEEETVRIYYRTRILEGDSVFDKARYIYTEKRG